MTNPLLANRRDYLLSMAHGLGSIAAATLLSSEASAAHGKQSGVAAESADPPPHHPPRVHRVVQIFLQGGLSHVDTLDYKPELEKLHGQTPPQGVQGFMGRVGRLHKAHFPFQQRGESGLCISDLFPQLAAVADELTVIRSMWSGTGNHTPATYEANSGFRTLGFPAAGTWISYGMGCEVDNLPAFVVVPDSRSLPTGAANNWSSGFLPARHQGVVLNLSGPAVRDLNPATATERSTQEARFAALEQLNRRHLAERAGNDALESRIRGYELAAKLQLAIPQVTDLDQETAETRTMYGVDNEHCRDFARACLLARRLLESGVRFIQLWSGAAFGSDVHWDAHGSVPDNHQREALKIDQPVAALLRDLRRRGMLDDTLVVFNTEFGRTPFAESAGDQAGPGRDHNPDTFSVWLAGGGLKHGIAYGTSDEIGWKVAENPVDVHDFHATILHLLGIDHTRLTFYHNGIQRRLTNVHGNLIRYILA